jgi:glycosyltransferase involved in cell wall biosynthesis
LAFDNASGDYILQIDDDDYYADPEVFNTLRCVTKPWAVFPVLAFGKRCHRKPPAIGLTGSAMFMYRRDTGLKFPDNTDYSADGQLVEELKSKFEYQSLDDVRELAIYPQANHGREQHEIDEYIPSKKPYQYAADGLTVDWFDRNARR